MKKLFKAVLSLALMTSLVACSTPKDDKTALSFTAGTYSGVAKGMNGEVKVDVVVDEKAIISVNVTENVETFGIGRGLTQTPIEVLPSKIVELQGLGVDTITGATITSYAILGATKDALTKAGADIAALEAIKATTTPKDATYDVDVVVVGAGVAGLSAGIEAREAGAKVLVVEKQGYAGGATVRSGGKLLAAGSEWQTKQNYTDTPQMMFDYLKSVGKEYLDDAKVMEFCNHSLETLNWMEGMGVKIQNVEAIHQSIAPWRVHNVVGAGGMTSGHGGQITVPMIKAYESTGDIIYNVAIEEVIMQDGKAVGVKGTAKDGSKVTVNAKSVILTTGGYAQNKEMMKAYSESIDEFHPATPLGNQGDGIKMAETVGAQIYHSPVAQTVYLSYASGVGINEEAGLIVTKEGKRVANEYTYQYHVGDAIFQSKSGHAYYIAALNDPNPTVQYAMSLEDTVKSNSIEDLASKINVDPATLKATVDRYNELCKKGKDDDFGKPADKMIEITGDTYGAILLKPSVTVTYGGIVTDIESHVLDKDNKPINGLYAAGETAFTGLFGTEYPGCGMAISGGSYYGRKAGLNAASGK